jgi:thiol-disulfide isomerase/thioredoxin
MFAAIVLVCCSYQAAKGAEIAPEFTLDGITSNVSLKDFSGKVVLLDFWASWCIPCRKSFPWMNAMQEKYAAQGFTVIAINVDTERALADDFLRKVPAQFAIAFDPDGKVAERYGLVGMPSSYLIDAKGAIAYRHVGFREEDRDDFEKQIRRILVDANQ